MCEYKSGNYRIQYAFKEAAGASGYAVRATYDNTIKPIENQPWAVMSHASYLNQYTDLSSLTDAIGAFCGFLTIGGTKYLDSVFDYDEAPLGFVWGTSTAINGPSYTAGGVVFTFCGPHGSESLRMQIAFDGSSIYSRRKNVNESWSLWTQI